MSRFIQPITAASLQGVMKTGAGSDGYKCALVLRNVLLDRSLDKGWGRIESPGDIFVERRSES